MPSENDTFFLTTHSEVHDIMRKRADDLDAFLSAQITALASHDRSRADCRVHRPRKSARRWPRRSSVAFGHRRPACAPSSTTGRRHPRSSPTSAAGLLDDEPRLPISSRSGWARCFAPQGFPDCPSH